MVQERNVVQILCLISITLIIYTSILSTIAFYSVSKNYVTKFDNFYEITAHKSSNRYVISLSARDCCC